MNIVFEFLKLEYYNHYHVYKKAEKYFEEINDAAPNLLMNYGNFTFPPQFLISKLSRALRVGGEGELVAENELTFGDFEMDPEDVPANTIFQIYLSLSFYYSGRYEDAARIINNLLNEVSLKNYPFVLMEVKALLALQYCLQQDIELFNQLSNSIQRQIRLLGKDACENVLLFLKMLKSALSEAARDKHKKITEIAERIRMIPQSNYFSPTTFIRLDEPLIKKLSGIKY